MRDVNVMLEMSQRQKKDCGALVHDLLAILYTTAIMMEYKTQCLLLSVLHIENCIHNAVLKGIEGHLSGCMHVQYLLGKVALCCPLLFYPCCHFTDVLSD